MHSGKIRDCAALLGRQSGAASVEHSMGDPPEVQHRDWGKVQLIKGFRHEELTLITSTHIKRTICR